MTARQSGTKRARRERKKIEDGLAHKSARTLRTAVSGHFSLDYVICIACPVPPTFSVSRRYGFDKVIRGISKKDI